MTVRTALERPSEVRLKVVPHSTPKRPGLPEQRAPPPELRSEVHPGLEGGGRGRKPCASCRLLPQASARQRGAESGRTVTTQPLGRERQCSGGGDQGKGHQRSPPVPRLPWGQ